jgi:hypothetical protein
MLRQGFAQDGPVDPDRAGMCHIPGGTFHMGSDMHYPEERPAHLVSVNAKAARFCVRRAIAGAIGRLRTLRTSTRNGMDHDHELR